MIINSFMGPETEITKAEYRKAASYFGSKGKGYKYGLVTVTFREAGVYLLSCSRAVSSSSSSPGVIPGPTLVAGKKIGDSSVGVQTMTNGCLLLNVENANDTITVGEPGSYANSNYYNCCCFVFGNWTADNKSPLFERVT